MSDFKSLLKLGIDQLPAGQKVPGKSVVNTLKRAGVNKDELKFSGFEDTIDVNKKYSPEELAKIEAGRKDKFDEVVIDEFRGTSIHDEAHPTQSNSYRRVVTTFSEGDKRNSRFTSEAHFPEVKDYQMHRSMFETEHKGDQASVLQELQSDLHFQGRRDGYKGTKTASDIDSEVGVTLDEQDVRLEQIVRRVDPDASYEWSNMFEEVANMLDDSRYSEHRTELLDIKNVVHTAVSRLDNLAGPVTPAQQATLRNLLAEGQEASDELLEQAGVITSRYGVSPDELDKVEALSRGEVPAGPPKSPFENNWLKKNMEAGVVDALNKGSRYLKIPLRGQKVNSLQRGSSQVVYGGGQVSSTAKRLAKSIDAKFSLESEFQRGADTVKADDITYVSVKLSEIGVGYAHRGGEQVKLTVADKLKTLRSLSAEYGIPEEYLDSYEAGIIDMKQLTALYRQHQVPDKTDYAVIEFAGQEVDASVVARLGEVNGRLQADEMHGVPPKNAFERQELIQEGVALSEKMKFKPKSQTFSMYTSPVATAFAAYTAFGAGYTEEQIVEQYKAAGEGEGDIKEILAATARIKEAVDSGYGIEEVRAMLMGQAVSFAGQEVPDVDMDEGKSWWTKVGDWFDEQDENALLVREKSFAALLGVPLEDVRVTRTAQQKRRDAYNKIVGLDPNLSNRDYAAALEIVSPVMTSLVMRASAFAGSSDARATVEHFQKASDAKMIEMSAKLGIELVKQDTEASDWDYLLGPGKWQARAKSGELVDVGPGFWSSIDAEKFELIGDVGGAYLGLTLASKYAKGNLLTKILGAGVGMTTGAVLGSQLDYMDAAVTLNADLDSAVAFNRGTTAAEMAIMGEVFGVAFMKGGKKLLGPLSDFLNKIKNGDTLGAKQSLKDTFLVTDEELDEVVEQTARLLELPENQNDKAVMAFVNTQPGGEEMIKEIGKLSPIASRRMADSVNDRAKDVNKMAAELAGKDPSILVKQDLDNYVASVKNQYGFVKRAAQEAPGTKQYDFDMHNLAIEPVINVMKSKIADPVALERFVRRADLIKNRVDSRTFVDLLDLRQLVNGFKYGSGMKGAIDYKGFRSLIRTIDAEIEKGAQTVFKDPREWLSSYKAANKSYSTMKGLEKNALFKMLSKTGDQKVLVRNFTKYMAATDSTWSDVLNQLPMSARIKAEGATIQTLVQKNTVGENMQAIHFPTLAEQLDNIQFTTPDARKLKAAIGEVAKVFKNDVPLSKNSGFVTQPTINQGLSDNLATKARYSLMSRVWSQSQQFFPGKDGRHAAMMVKAAKLLENPLNVKAVKDLMDELGSAATIKEDILKLQRAAAFEASQDQTSPLVKLYGEGPLKSGKGEGNPVKVHMSKIATHETIADIIQVEAIHQGDTKSIEIALKQRGYTYMASGTDKVKAL